MSTQLGTRQQQMIGLPDLKLAEEDGPPAIIHSQPSNPELERRGSSERVDHKAVLFRTAFERLAVFKSQSLATDAIITSGPLRIGAHRFNLNIYSLSYINFRIVLAAAIPFFQGLFLSPHPSEDKETVLEIDGVDPNVIISIIEWAYTGKLY